MSLENNKKLSDYKVVIFDVYGTLVDWESAIYAALRPLLDRSPIAKRWTRAEALKAFSAVEGDLQAQFPTMLYRDLLAKTHEVLTARLIAASGKEPPTSTLDAGGSPTLGEASTSDTIEPPPNVHQAFADSIKSWPPFSDTVQALKILAKYYRLTVLSNVDRDSFSYTHALLSSPSPHAAAHTDIYTYPSPNPNPYWLPQTVLGSESPFSLILTAQDNGVYKPSVEAFNAALRVIRSQEATLNAKKDDVLVVAQSLFHDHMPANKLGLQSVWINRAGASMGVEGGPKYGWKFATLGEMADALEKESKL